MYASNHGTTDGLQANAAYVKQKNSKTKQTGSTSEAPCFNFAKGRACRNNPCNFSHQQPEQKSVKQNSTFSPAPPSPTPHVGQNETPKCGKCGENHANKECKCKSVCPWCTKIGHLEHLCNQKKAGKPRAYISQEGAQLKCNMVIVGESLPVCYSADVSIPTPPGCITEKFYADTGANRSIHPNGRSAVSFYRMPLEIATATSGKRGGGKNAALLSSR